jgi:methyltransferase-like protein/SAM-dependent methyltransferase
MTPYDTVTYPAYAYIQTHPDHVATLARLCGLAPAPIETCRVFEVGCGDAANLIPMAIRLPKASFRGFDLAASAIQRGQEMVRELGIANLTLEQLDICSAPDRLGEFDYIIAHGFYSWVPKSARDKLMAICKASLAPHGVAFISYNTFPGGHIRRMVREMMLFHIDRAPDAQTKIVQARALLGFLSNLCQGDDEYQRLLKKEFERVRQYPPGYLYHDDLAEISDPFYMYEFVNHAVQYGLQFLGDLNSTFVNVGNVDAETVQALAGLEKSDPVLREQYLDFACCRRFRQTLLCHQGLSVDHQLDPRRVEGLFVSSPAVASSEVSLAPDVEIEFRGGRNASLKTSHPVLKAAMVALRTAWPERLSFPDLRSAAAGLLDVPPDAISPGLLAEGVAAAFSMRALDLHVYPPQVTNRPGDYPRADRLTRWQAERGDLLTNVLHQTVKLESGTRKLVALLDGTRDRRQLAHELNTDPQEVDQALHTLSAMALLEV